MIVEALRVLVKAAGENIEAVRMILEVVRVVIKALRVLVEVSKWSKTTID